MIACLITNYFAVIPIVCQDVVMLDPSFIYQGIEVHDQHSDLRLDIDNMSYEVNIPVCSQHFVFSAHWIF
jgi:hypothetical protein